MHLPDKINDPILEAGVEIRFKPTMPYKEIFELLSQALRDIYPHSERLLILQIPEETREAIPSLRFQPYYRLRSPHTNYVVQIGANMLSVFVLQPYKGWNSLLEETKKVFSKLTEVNVGQIERCSLKYVDTFDADVFTLLNLSISSQLDFEFSNTAMRFQSEFKHDEFDCILQLNNRVKLLIDENKTLTGSLLDLEVIYEQFNSDFFERYPEILEKAHQTEKKIFFGLLKEDTLKSLNPTYNA
jgi:uncharacterized protein (TIGR04255 family)